MKNVPEYTDGYFNLFYVQEDQESDFPEKYLKDAGMKIWFRELSVYDRIRFALNEQGKEVTMKIAIPQFKEIDSNCVVQIAGKFHDIETAAHIRNRDGFQETELTLIRPQNNREVRFR